MKQSPFNITRALTRYPTKLKVLLPCSVLVLVIALMGCDSLRGYGIAPTVTNGTPTVATPTVSVDSLVTPVPTTTLAPTKVPSPSSTSGPVSQTVMIFLVAIGDNGQTGKKIGCDDSIVAVERRISATKEVLYAAFSELLALKQRDYGESGLVNALYQAELTLDSVTLVNGLATIQLSGVLSLSGVCDIPRAEAQLTETALQFATVKEVSILLNGVPLHEALSLQ